MSDSESDLLPSNVFTFQNEDTMVSAKGPGLNSANITNLTFRNNVMTSTMHMPRNFERQRFAEPSFDQRSMYYRRETSPSSLYSGSDMRARNLHQSYYGGGSSQRSMYYGRSGSPMSMRSMGSNLSVSAVDIALAFKNENFNKHDLRMIKDAYNKFMKRRIRKKVERRRNMRLFLKGYRRKSGYDSGEQGSNSSISSDDCKSTSSAMYKENMSCRSTRTDLSDFRRNFIDSNMYKDCTDKFKQNAVRNMLLMPSAGISISKDRFNAMNSVQNVPELSQKSFAAPNPVQKPQFTQKDRFKNGYLLPAQRFNKSVASVPILERDPRLRARQNAWMSTNQKGSETSKQNGHVNGETDSDQEEIFSEVTVREKSMLNGEPQLNKTVDQGKRGLEIEDNKCSDRKRQKLSSPAKSLKANELLKENNPKMARKVVKNNEEKNKTENDREECSANKNNEEFNFLKPQFPVRKSGPAKIKEKLISKSAMPRTDVIIPPSRPQIEEVSVPVVKPITETQQVSSEVQSEAMQNSNSDLSMRPSFIKRKLFTQKMDVTEKKNLSSDALNVNSPQTNVYSAIQKEKHKARKLVTNQSCLSRDIVKEGNNLLDLIHKIVPPDRMNVTNVSNKTSISTSVSSKNPNVEDDKWDVTSVISTCNNDDCSETYTDEEIFAPNNTTRKSNNNVKKTNIVNEPKENVKSTNEIKITDDSIRYSIKNISECKILVEKLPQNKLVTQSKHNALTRKANVPVIENDHKKSVYNCVKSFWDTDFESDMERESPAPKRALNRSETVKENQNNSVVGREIKVPKINKTLNLSLATVSGSIKSKTMPTNNLSQLKKFNISKTLSIKSLLSPKPGKSKPKTAKEVNGHQEINIIEDIPKETDPKKKQTKQDSNSKSTSNVNTQTKKAEPKKTNIKNSTDALNTTSKSVKSPPKTKAKVAKPQTNKANNKVVSNVGLSGRSVRTPKRKACCEETNDDHNKSAKSSASKSKQKKNNSVKKPKLIDSNSTKSKTSKKINDSVSQEPATKPKVNKINASISKQSRACKTIKNNKKSEPEAEQPKILEIETMNRTLRSRRIDLSSSINSSTENVTLQIRSLRTRRVDLSNSLKNSSFDETIKKGPPTIAGSKKTVAKSNRSDALSKKSRSVRNQTLK